MYTYNILELVKDSSGIIQRVKSEIVKDGVSVKVSFILLDPSENPTPYENLTKELVVSWIKTHPNYNAVIESLEYSWKESQYESVIEFPWNG